MDVYIVTWWTRTRSDGFIDIASNLQDAMQRAHQLEGEPLGWQAEEHPLGTETRIWRAAGKRKRHYTIERRSL
ncbi:hypothetical protein HNR42_003313 [Deinobacterium chartae]|uniref:Uncharacterized protein n=1 Tax=Deinobacterium chartae TaxID=521158 RepID=A0A841I3H5_9DEIO|nr:hypothetical protein [Deinobacterium chartae]MBB6099853.1 hypothetical protein [Deinobacterium chartae]